MGKKVGHLHLRWLNPCPGPRRHPPALPEDRRAGNQHGPAGLPSPRHLRLAVESYGRVRGKAFTIGELVTLYNSLLA